MVMLLGQKVRASYVDLKNPLRQKTFIGTVIASYEDDAHLLKLDNEDEIVVQEYEINEILS